MDRAALLAAAWTHFVITMSGWPLDGRPNEYYGRTTAYWTTHVTCMLMFIRWLPSADVWPQLFVMTGLLFQHTPRARLRMSTNMTAATMAAFGAAIATAGGTPAVAEVGATWYAAAVIYSRPPAVWCEAAALIWYYTATLAGMVISAHQGHWPWAMTLFIMFVFGYL